jgi:hypothetical protein
VSVFDFTDSAHPIEIAFFDRGPIDAKQLVTGGYWSAYWFNGNIYGSEIARGIDVFRLRPSEYLSQNEIDAATLVHNDELNTQQQLKIEWPATSVVALAYIDQLNRHKAIDPARARAVRSALDRADALQTARNVRGAAAGNSSAVESLHAVARQLEGDARAGSGRDADRLRALAVTLDARAAKLQ